MSIGKHLDNEETNRKVCEMHLAGKLNKEIAIECKMHVSTVRPILMKHNLGKKGMLLELEKQEILKAYNDMLPDLPRNFQKVLEKQFNRSGTAVANLLREYNVREALGVKRYQHDEDYFGKIDHPDKAYWLGFIAADGNVYKNVLHIGIHAEDFEHLELFKKDIKATNPVKIKTYKSKGKDSKISRIDIYSAKTILDLFNHGIHANKTATLDWNNCTKNIPEKYKIDFVRGFFDGDGCWKNKGRKIAFDIGVANEHFITDLQLWFANYVQINLVKIQKRNNGKFFVYAKGGINNVKKIASIMYNDNRCLSRKFEKVTKTIQSLEDCTT